MRLSKNVFTDLGILMIGFGVLIGFVFPLFMRAIGVPGEYVFTLQFVISCITAGIIVGVLNFLLSRFVVGSRLKLLSKRMHFIQGRLIGRMTNEEIDECTSDKCMIPVDSEDEIGESSRAFNNLVNELSLSLKAENSIKECNEMLASQLELSGITQKALDHIVDYTQSSGGAVLIERGGELELSASFAVDQPQLLASYDGIWKSLKQLKRLRYQLQEQVKITHSLVTFRPAEILIEPLIHKGAAIGVVLLAAAEPFSDKVLYGFEMCIRTLTLALRNAVTYEQLQQLAANDPLTGVYNRRFGMVRLQEEFSRSVRSQIPIGVIMVDIDHFKSVNDTYGHTVGDKILVTMSRIAKMALREGDIMLRYGGEEFLVIMPGANRHDSEFVAERLRRMVEEAKTPYGNQQISITVSLGFASYPETEVSHENELVSLADNALYEAKERGRNRCAFR
ncbi:MAG: sensor domain-containing diguanylate cyclase [Spirochaetales bacterium]|jgi:two-component system cell cycle response regulator|nr:sensor domain-containing diguanylate cyclase [Spirochaetales bacterium]